LLDICDEHLDELGKNLVKMLVDNHRLSAIPQIAFQYEQLKAQHYQHIKVDIISAYPVEPPQQQQIEAILQKHYHKAIDINTDVDKSLVGGWLIRAGDQVIDISVKGRIQQLASELRG
jgi:F-type H+-transporting ATPase subunit delta